MFHQRVLRHKNYVIGLALSASMLCMAFFALSGIARQSLVDESLWLYNRVPKYWKNLFEADFKGTRISDKPGITVALVSGAGMLPGGYLHNYKDYKVLNYRQNGIAGFNVEKFYTAFRAPIAMFVVLMLPVFYLLLHPLIGRGGALFAIAGIATSPILIGMSRMVNPDALLWVFVPLTILAYLNIIHATHPARRRRFTWATGILLGLALLTKYVANVLFVFFIGLILLDIIVRPSKTPVHKRMRAHLRTYGTITLIALGTITALFPAVWVKPRKLLDLTVLSQAFESTWPYAVGLLVFFLLDALVWRSRIVRTLIAPLQRYQKLLTRLILGAFLLSAALMFFNTLAGMPWYNFQDILASPKSSYGDVGFWGVYLAAFFPLLFGVTPVLLLFVLGTIVALMRGTLPSTAQFSALAILAFIILYDVGSSANGVAATLRYQIVLFPLLFVLMGIGAAHLVHHVTTPARRLAVASAVFALIFGSGVYSLWTIRPYYFSYANVLLPERYILNPKEMGDGSYQIAQFLNTLPNAENLTIWSDKRGVCRIFVGSCASTTDFKKYLTQGYHFSYYVVSSGRQKKITRDVKRKQKYNPKYLILFDKLYTTDAPPVHTITLGRSSNTVRVFDARTIDISYTQDPTKPAL